MFNLFSTNYFTNWDDLAPSEIMDARQCQSIEKMEQLPSPRILKSHLPFHLLPPRLLNTAKVSHTYTVSYFGNFKVSID